MIIGNGSRLGSNPMRLMGGTQFMMDMNIPRPFVGALMNQSVAFGKLASSPGGTQPPESWIRPIKSGDLNSYGSMAGISSVVSGITKGGNIQAPDIVGAGTIPTVNLQSLLQMYCIGAYTLLGTGEVTSSIAKGVSIASNVSGEGGIQAFLGLIPFMISYLVGEGLLEADTIELTAPIASDLEGDGLLEGSIGLVSSLMMSTTAGGDLEGTLGNIASLYADVVGSSTFESMLAVLAWCVSNILGRGEVTPTMRSDSYLSSTITSAGEVVTAQSCATAVWNALASAYNVPSTMGEKLNDAGSASNPWTELIEGNFTAAEILRIMSAALAGKTSGAGGTEITFRDLNDTKDRIVGTLDVDNNRIEVELDGTE